MEARQGRDAAGGSMRSTTARPAMLFGRGRSSQWRYGHSDTPSTGVAIHTANLSDEQEETQVCNFSSV